VGWCMDRKALVDYLRVHVVGGSGAVRFRRLMQSFGSAGRIARATRSELMGVEGIGEATAQTIVEGLQSARPEHELELAERSGARIVTFEDEDYPELLRQCPSPPALLYVRGEIRKTDALAVAIVGTRRAGRYGSEQAYRFASLLAGAGFTVVSGLARGIDAQAHRGALHVGGRTIAVLGAGLNRLYPPEHRELAESIASGRGAVISELPMEFEPDARNFPARNRIVAAMTVGTLVIEAPEKSGALITADYAADFSREVFAIPGPIDDPGFSGAHRLIKIAKAKLVTSLQDILDELHHAGELMSQQVRETGQPTEPLFARVERSQLDCLPQVERRIWEFLSDANDIDTICACCNVSPAEASSSVTMLQLKGLLQRLPGNQYVRR